MPQLSRWPKEAWIPLAAGFFWLWRAPEHGLPGFVFSVLPGCLLLGSGFAMLAMPGDRRIAQFAALGGVLGVLFALPAFFVVGIGAGLLLVAASVLGFVAAGFHSVRLEAAEEDVPPADRSVTTSLQVACDEALLALMLLGLPMPTSAVNERVAREVHDARALFESRGWLEKPASYHRTPPPLEKPHLVTRRVRGIEYQHLSFESGYEPEPDEPGRDRWLERAPNRIGHAWIVRHPGPPRPWLMCIHGYQMGLPAIDLAVFAPEYFHHRLGLNMILPVLPLHGPRKVGRRSGDGFIAGDALDTIHAEAQAMWDLRRLLGWVRGEGAKAVGVLGLSLGGYNTALLSCLDAGLACAITGIPLTDFTRAIFRHGPPLTLRDANWHGVEENELRAVKRVVSPLDMETLVSFDRRYIFGAVSDRLVPPDQVRDLWRHWGKPRIEWYQGGHLTFRAHAPVRRLVREALRESGLSP